MIFSIFVFISGGSDAGDPCRSQRGNALVHQPALAVSAEAHADDIRALFDRIQHSAVDAGIVAVAAVTQHLDRQDADIIRRGFCDDAGAMRAVTVGVMEGIGIVGDHGDAALCDPVR